MNACLDLCTVLGDCVFSVRPLVAGLLTLKPLVNTCDTPASESSASTYILPDLIDIVSGRWVGEREQSQDRK